MKAGVRLLEAKETITNPKTTMPKLKHFSKNWI